MRRHCVVAGLAGLLLCVQSAILCQSPARLEFDVASVKVDDAGTGGAGDKYPRGGTWKWTRIPLSFLVMYAYDVPTAQIANIPDLFQRREVAFDIIARMPPETTDAQFRMMLQSLLADRFSFVMHRETREVLVNTIEVAKGGTKLEAASGQCTQAQQSATLPSGQYRCGEVVHRLQVQDGRIRHEYFGRSVAMGDLAAALSLENGPVIDDTGIGGRFDIDVTVEAPLLPHSDDPDEMSNRSFEYHRVFNSAFEKQAGLSIDMGKLRKHAVSVIVVDHVEMPKPN